jgi:hypothetical protein
MKYVKLKFLKFLPFDAYLAWSNVLLVEVAEVEVSGAPGQVGDEDHLVGVL